jgi:16S rRNA (guanine527-N7)-methyltransferase
MTTLVSGVEVSRETEAAINIFLDRIARWTVKINLVARGAVRELRERHLVDSAQLFSHLRPADTSWADLGSGGGFPGIVIAILARELRPDLRVTLVESDQRKATFLRMIVAELSLMADVKPFRIGELAPLGADVVSARALASLEVLLGMSSQHLAPNGMALFLKGESYRDEIATARKTWHFDVEEIPSVTENVAALLKIKDIRRA